MRNNFVSIPLSMPTSTGSVFMFWHKNSTNTWRNSRRQRSVIAPRRPLFEIGEESSDVNNRAAAYLASVLAEYAAMSASPPMESEL